MDMKLGNIKGFDNLFFGDKEKPQKIQGIDHFNSFFDEAIEMLDTANSMQKEAQQKQIDFVTGKSDDMIGLSMAQSRASSAVQFTSQVTGKILTAYQEIMRIQM